MSTVHRFLKMLTLLPSNGEKISVKKLDKISGVKSMQINRVWPHWFAIVTP
jgi:hypothetical protein